MIKTVTDALNNNKPYGRSWEDFLLPDQMEFLHKAFLEFITSAAPLVNYATERFTIPTDKQVIDMAIIFNDGKLEHEKLSDMVSMCQFVMDRLYENGDISKPSSKENK